MQDKELAAFGEIRTPLEMILLDKIQELEYHLDCCEELIETQEQFVIQLKGFYKEAQTSSERWQSQCDWLVKTFSIKE